MLNKEYIQISGTDVTKEEITLQTILFNFQNNVNFQNILLSKKTVKKYKHNKNVSAININFHQNHFQKMWTVFNLKIVYLYITILIHIKTTAYA